MTIKTSDDLPNEMRHNWKLICRYEYQDFDEKKEHLLTKCLYCEKWADQKDEENHYKHVLGWCIYDSDKSRKMDTLDDDSGSDGSSFSWTGHEELDSDANDSTARAIKDIIDEWMKEEGIKKDEDDEEKDWTTKRGDIEDDED